VDGRLVIAGNDMGAARSTRALVKTLELENKTFFTGLLQGRERLEALADATVLVYPAEDEVFGLVPLEALLVGTPVIVAGDSGCGEIIGSVGGGHIVPRGDVAALTEALRAVLNEPGRWAAAAVSAGLGVKSAYGGDVVAREMARLYRALIS
jgi:glycosyltransferase involved in cell wall biosynthesis